MPRLTSLLERTKDYRYMLVGGTLWGFYGLPWGQDEIAKADQGENCIGLTCQSRHVNSSQKTPRFVAPTDPWWHSPHLPDIDMVRRRLAVYGHRQYHGPHTDRVQQLRGRWEGQKFWSRPGAGHQQLLWELFWSLTATDGSLEAALGWWWRLSCTLGEVPIFPYGIL